MLTKVNSRDIPIPSRFPPLETDVPCVNTVRSLSTIIAHVRTASTSNRIRTERNSNSFRTSATAKTIKTHEKPWYKATTTASPNRWSTLHPVHRPMPSTTITHRIISPFREENNHQLRRVMACLAGPLSVHLTGNELTILSVYQSSKIDSFHENVRWQNDGNDVRFGSLADLTDNISLMSASGGKAAVRRSDFADL